MAGYKILDVVVLAHVLACVELVESVVVEEGKHVKEGSLRHVVVHI